jgi:hypothetical protein
LRKFVLLCGLLLAASATVQAQPARPGEYVVRRIDGARIPEKDLAAVKALGVHGLEVMAIYPRVLGVRADRRTADLLAAQGLRVEPNYIYRLAAAPYSGWHLDRAVQRTPWTPSRGAPTDPRSAGTLYLLDTFGYDPAGELGDRLVRGPDFIGTNDGAYECRGHGTAMADLAAGRRLGMNPFTRVVSIRIVDCQGNVSHLATLAAFDWILDEGIQRFGPGVISMSWGAFDIPRNPYAGQFQALREAGILLVAAAMNSSQDASAVMPCAFADLCVGASNADDVRASFSDFGPAVDLFAPGEAVSSFGPDGQMGAGSGTSNSTPLVAATLLLLKGRYPQLPAARLADLLLANATYGALGGNLGAGSPNRLLFAGPVTENVAGGDAQYSRRTRKLTASVRIALNGGATLSEWADFHRGARGANGKCKGKPFAHGTVDDEGWATASSTGAASVSRVCIATELGGVFEQRVTVAR